MTVPSCTHPGGRPNSRRPPGWSRLLPQRLAGLDLDFARRGLLQHRDADRQDAVVVRGVDAGRVQVLREVDAAGERSHRALPYEELLVLGVLFFAAGADGEDAAVDRELDGSRVDARQVEAEDPLVLAPA